MEVVHIGAECYPFAKVGGLVDVVGALPKYQNSIECHVSVLIPYYDTAVIKENKFDCVHSGFVQLGNFNFLFNVQKEQKAQLGYELYLIEIAQLFDRTAIYGY